MEGRGGEVREEEGSVSHFRCNVRPSPRSTPSLSCSWSPANQPSFLPYSLLPLFVSPSIFLCSPFFLFLPYFFFPVIPFHFHSSPPSISSLHFLSHIQLLFLVFFHSSTSLYFFPLLFLCLYTPQLDCLSALSPLPFSLSPTTQGSIDCNNVLQAIPKGFWLPVGPSTRH